MSNFLGIKVVDDVDWICEFRVGCNFGAQEEIPDCRRHYKLQYQKVHVVHFAVNGTALADRHEPSDVCAFLSFQLRQQWKIEI